MGSAHVHEAVAAAATVPVVTIPQPVSLPERSESPAPPAGLPEGFRFLFAFDYFSVFERKNPLAAVEAFTRAFEPGSGAALIVKSLNHDHDLDSHERLRLAAAAHPDVHLIEDAPDAERARRPLQRLRLLPVAAPRGGLRLHDGRGDVRGQAGDRHRLLGQPRLHDARRTPTWSTTRWCRSARATLPYPAGGDGPSPTWSTPRASCARCSTTRRRPPGAESLRPQTSGGPTPPRPRAARWRPGCAC